VIPTQGPKIDESTTSKSEKREIVGKWLSKASLTLKSALPPKKEYRPGCRILHDTAKKIQVQDKCPVGWSTRLEKKLEWKKESQSETTADPPQPESK